MYTQIQKLQHRACSLPKGSLQHLYRQKHSQSMSLSASFTARYAYTTPKNTVCRIGQIPAHVTALEIRSPTGSDPVVPRIDQAHHHRREFLPLYTH